jgi:hypothetical protein
MVTFVCHAPAQRGQYKVLLCHCYMHGCDLNHSKRFSRLLRAKVRAFASGNHWDVYEQLPADTPAGVLLTTWMCVTDRYTHTPYLGNGSVCSSFPLRFLNDGYKQAISITCLPHCSTRKCWYLGNALHCAFATDLLFLNARVLFGPVNNKSHSCLACSF